MLSERLSLESFQDAVTRSVDHRFRGHDGPTARAVATYVASLHAADLGLAVLCDAGDELGWQHMMETHRPALYRAATAMTGSHATGRELADALWAELFGVGRTRASMTPGSPRASLLGYFHGRSTLSTWLRSVLAQRHVDHIRTGQRFSSLDDDGEDERPTESRSHLPIAEAPDPARPGAVERVRDALRDAVHALEPGDRLRLSYYHVQGLTLAAIGRLTGEHEATVSRKLTRTRARVRTDVERTLQERHRMTPEEIELCYQYVIEDPSVDVGMLVDG